MANLFEFPSISQQLLIKLKINSFTDIVRIPKGYWRNIELGCKELFIIPSPVMSTSTQIMKKSTILTPTSLYEAFFLTANCIWLAYTMIYFNPEPKSPPAVTAHHWFVNLYGTLYWFVIIGTNHICEFI